MRSKTMNMYLSTCHVLQVNILPQMGKVTDGGAKSNGNGASQMPSFQPA